MDKVIDQWPTIVTLIGLYIANVYGPLVLAKFQSKSAKEEVVMEGDIELEKFYVQKSLERQDLEISKLMANVESLNQKIAAMEEKMEDKDKALEKKTEELTQVLEMIENYKLIVEQKEEEIDNLKEEKMILQEELDRLRGE